MWSQALLSKEHQGEQGKADGTLAQSLKVDFCPPISCAWDRLRSKVD